ncbi:hypothetical protein [Leptolyngbya iicbica]|uniref:Uncharacterized protein n=2 Tax=Cyanophyceae TaxID=3028117 RepID=A0A4Q7EGE2_9CYAN|nr:hypothetical protein [Leptolyngbya sp. LK]RZM82405.1 hypothetical protein DYY88_03945 [Leptolyngbya sp. LK]
MTNQLTRLTAIAFVLIASEVTVYVGNVLSCPFYTLAEWLTPTGWPVSDILSTWLARSVINFASSFSRSPVSFFRFVS